MRAGTIVALLVGVAIATAAFTWDHIAEKTFGRVYRIEREEDAADLRRIAHACSRAIQAADEAIASGRPFESLAELEALPITYEADLPPLSLSRDGDGYMLYYKLNWDAGLFYRSRSRVWTFDAGLGEGASPLWQGSNKALLPSRHGGQF